jgi:hypothetical protein
MSAPQSTVTNAVVSHSTTTWKTRATQADWDKIITDGMIYLLAVGGFYLGYQTLYDLATTVGYTPHQAFVAAALADIAILAYSRKAVAEIKAGRSAWGIRLIVAAFSLATFGLQLRAAWPHPTAVGFHGMAPAVWILGHEMMLRGRLRTAKAARRAAQVAAGLRPAPLPAIRLSWWLLDPYHTFIIWRLVKLWEKPQDEVIRNEAAKRKDKGKNVPRAWEGYLLTAETPAAEETAEEPEQEEETAPETGLYRLSDPTEKVPTEDFDAFLLNLPVAPVKGRPEDKAIEYIREVDKLAAKADIAVTDRFIAGLLGVHASRVCRLRKVMAPANP